MVEIQYESYKNCLQGQDGFVDPSSLKEILSMSKEELDSLYSSWLDTFEKNNKLYDLALLEQRKENEKLISLLKESFPTEALTKRGDVKSKYEKLIRVEELELSKQKPIYPRLLSYVYSKDANEKISVDIEQGDITQWFDIRVYVERYKQKEIKIIKEKSALLRESEDIERCKEYIYSQNESILGLTTLKEFSDRADILKIKELIELQSKNLNGCVNIKNICPNCDFWDGKSYRCSCGHISTSRLIKYHTYIIDSIIYVWYYFYIIDR